MRKIVTTQENPPIPSNNYDWSSCRENYELGDKIGYGKTELEAINDLLEKEECYDGFKAGVEFATRWIPVEEELPEDGKIVLMKTLNSVFIGRFEDSHFYLNEIVNNTQLIIVGVIEWRPIEFK